MNIANINYKSNFKILIELNNYTGEDFKLVFFTTNTVQKRFTCSYLNGTYTNCAYIDDDHVLCTFDAGCFKPGLLKCEVTYSFYDEGTSSKKYKIVSTDLVEAYVDGVQSHIEITNNSTGVVNTPEFAVYLLGTILQSKPAKIKLNGVTYVQDNGVVDLGNVSGLSLGNVSSALDHIYNILLKVVYSSSQIDELAKLRSLIDAINESEGTVES